MFKNRFTEFQKNLLSEIKKISKFYAKTLYGGQILQKEPTPPHDLAFKSVFKICIPAFYHISPAFNHISGALSPYFRLIIKNLSTFVANVSYKNFNIYHTYILFQIFQNQPNNELLDIKMIGHYLFIIIYLDILLIISYVLY